MILKILLMLNAVDFFDLFHVEQIKKIYLPK